MKTRIGRPHAPSAVSVVSDRAAWMPDSAAGVTDGVAGVTYRAAGVTYRAAEMTRFVGPAGMTAGAGAVCLLFGEVGNSPTRRLVAEPVKGICVTIASLMNSASRSCLRLRKAIAL